LSSIYFATPKNSATSGLGSGEDHIKEESKKEIMKITIKKYLSFNLNLILETKTEIIKIIISNEKNNFVFK